MKKLILVVSMALSALALVPVASASAEVASCTFEGKAEFPGKPLKFASQKKVKYTFATNAGVGNNCVTEKEGTFKGAEVVASVSGELEGGCQESTSEPGGTGSLKLGAKAAKNFNFAFTGNGTEVTFTTTGGLESTGHASFAADKTGVERCLVEQKPVTELNFTATAVAK